MRQLQGRRVQGANDAKRLAHGDILRVSAAYLGLKAVCDPGFVQSLEALRQRALQDDIEGELVVVGGQCFRLALPGISELPGVLQKHTFLDIFPLPSYGTRSVGVANVVQCLSAAVSFTGGRTNWMEY